MNLLVVLLPLVFVVQATELLTNSQIDDEMFSDDATYNSWVPRSGTTNPSCSGGTCEADPEHCCNIHATDTDYLTGEDQGIGANHVRLDVYASDGDEACWHDLCFDNRPQNYPSGTNGGLRDYMSDWHNKDYSNNPTNDLCTQECGSKKCADGHNSGSCSSHGGICPERTEADCITQCQTITDCYGFNFNPSQFACYLLVHRPGRNFAGSNGYVSPCQDFTSANGAYTMLEKTYYTPAPTSSPTTSAPTKTPTKTPTSSPTTSAPTSSPTTSAPTSSPTTSAPTKTPTSSPTTSAPTSSPTTSAPTSSPTNPTKEAGRYATKIGRAHV